jgi:hypothetical protein
MTVNVVHMPPFQHDQIGILPIDTVTRVGFMSWLMFHLADMFHIFVLSFTGDLLAIESNFNSRQIANWILLNPLASNVLDGL